MAELPQSWGLTTQPRADGKLDIIGKTDAGENYRVRTTDGPVVTDTDISELRDADREAYSSRGTAAKEYIGKLTSHAQRLERDRNDTFGDSLVEPAGEVMFAATDRRGHSSPFTGSTRAYRSGFDNWMRSLGKEN